MPELNLRILNVGTSGNTVRALAARWQRDVIDLAPDYLSIMIGINDVWRQFDTPLNPEQHVGPNEYEGTLRQLVSATQSKLKKLILMTPFFIEPSLEDDMRRRMDEYGSIVKRVAQEFDAILVDTQVAFDRVLRHRHSAAIAWDRVHPGHVGHMVLARAFLQSVMAPFEPLGAKRHS